MSYSSKQQPTRRMLQFWNMHTKHRDTQYHIRNIIELKKTYRSNQRQWCWVISLWPLTKRQDYWEKLNKKNLKLNIINQMDPTDIYEILHPVWMYFLYIWIQIYIKYMCVSVYYVLYINICVIFPEDHNISSKLTIYEVIKQI